MNDYYIIFTSPTMQPKTQFKVKKEDLLRLIRSQNGSYCAYYRLNSTKAGIASFAFYQKAEELQQVIEAEYRTNPEYYI